MDTLSESIQDYPNMNQENKTEYNPYSLKGKVLTKMITQAKHDM